MILKLVLWCHGTEKILWSEWDLMCKVHFGDIKVMWQLQREDAKLNSPINNGPWHTEQIIGVNWGLIRASASPLFTVNLNQLSPRKKKVRPLQMIQYIRNYYIIAMKDRDDNWVSIFYNLSTLRSYIAYYYFTLTNKLTYCLLLSFNWHFSHSWLVRERHTQIHNSYLFLKKFSWISGCFPHSFFRFLCYHVPGKNMVENLRIFKCKIALHKHLSKHK